MPGFFPVQLVSLMLMSLNILQRLELAQKVSAAASASFAFGAGAGAAAGAAAGIGIAKPGLVPFVVTLPFKILNAPFYFLGGGHAADKRIRTLELAANNLQELQTAWINSIKDQVFFFDGLEVRLSQEYINKLKESFVGVATTSSGQGKFQMTNPCNPSFCKLGQFVDPFDERYTLIVINEQGRKVVTVILLIVSCVCGSILLLMAFRRAVRYSFRASRAFKGLIEQERVRDLLCYSLSVKE